MTAAICPEVQKNASRTFGILLKRHGLSFKARMLNKDYKEMLQCLLEEEVKFLLVGAYALAVHGFPPTPMGKTSRSASTACAPVRREARPQEWTLSTPARAATR